MSEGGESGEEVTEELQGDVYAPSQPQHSGNAFAELC